MNKTLPVLLVVAVGVGLLVTRNKEQVLPEIPPEVPMEPAPDIPTQADILASDNFQQLDDYYNTITVLYLGHHISFDEYMALYSIYTQRFYELWEGMS